MKNLQKNDNRWIGIIAATYGFFAVALGAFGAHALKTLTSPERLETWQTAVDYQIFHSLALLAVMIISLHDNSKRLHLVALCFSLGVAIFSGSLYVLVLTNITWLGMVTPIGGLLMLAGWVLLLLHFKTGNPSA